MSIAEKAYETSLYEHIFRSIDIGVIIMRLEEANDLTIFRIMDLNPAASKLAGTAAEQLVGKTLADVPKVLATSISEHCREVVLSGRPRDLGQLHFGGDFINEGVYEFRLYPLPNQCAAVAFRNITGRLQVERALHESEESFRLLVSSVKDYAIFRLDTQGYVRSWNSGAQQIKGYSAQEIIGKHFSIFYPPDAIKLGKPQHALREAAKGGRFQEEGWRLRKDGSRFWADVVITALRDEAGTLCGFAKVTHDGSERRQREEVLRQSRHELKTRIEDRRAEISKINQDLGNQVLERNRAEEQLRASLDQLRALAGRLQKAREEERALLAREIHDEMGQACTALKMDLVWLLRKLPETDQRLHERARSMLKLIDEAIRSTRRIASELRPSTLDDLGLAAAIEWQAQEFEARSGVQCRVTLPTETLVLNRELSTAVFRIFQESLTNVLRHANASRVEVQLSKGAEVLTLKVDDNGIGFDATSDALSKSLGLLGMRERALLVGGEFKVTSAPGKGTSVTVRVPLAERKGNESQDGISLPNNPGSNSIERN